MSGSTFPAKSRGNFKNVFNRHSVRDKIELLSEARAGIEPTHSAFAEPCLTTWLPRRKLAEFREEETEARPRRCGMPHGAPSRLTRE